jgi:hypothetical protein
MHCVSLFITGNNKAVLMADRTRGMTLASRKALVYGHAPRRSSGHLAKRTVETGFQHSRVWGVTFYSLDVTRQAS